MKKFALFLPLLFFCMLSGKAQDTIGINPNNSAVTPDTIVFGDTVRYQILLKNFGPTSLNGNVYFMVKANNRTPFGLGVVTIGNLNPGMDTLIYFTDTSSMAKYDGGINILIVWPDKPGTITRDSFTEYTFAKYPVANEPEPDEPALISLFPNPTSGKLIFRRTSGIEPESYKVYDSRGGIIRQAAVLPDEMDFSFLPAGLYIFEFRLPGGKVQRSKLIIE